jgi:hypothetical protein
MQSYKCEKLGNVYPRQTDIVLERFIAP